MIVQGTKNFTRLAEEKHMAGQQQTPKELVQGDQNYQEFHETLKESNRKRVLVLQQIVALQVWGTSF